MADALLWACPRQMFFLKHLPGPGFPLQVLPLPQKTSTHAKAFHCNPSRGYFPCLLFCTIPYVQVAFAYAPTTAHALSTSGYSPQSVAKYAIIIVYLPTQK